MSSGHFQSEVRRRTRFIPACVASPSMGVPSITPFAIMLSVRFRVHPHELVAPMWVLEVKEYLIVNDL
jgi:hypothetical protein